MYVDEVKLTNLRCFSCAAFKLSNVDSTIEYTSPYPNINLILGNNGMGKSTVLRGIALGVLSSIIQNSGFHPYSLVRRVGTKTSTSKKLSKANIMVTMRLHEQDHKGAVGCTIETGMSIIRRNTSEMIEVDRDDNPIWDAMFDEKSNAFLMVGYGATRRVEESSNVDFSSRKRGRQIRYQRVASLFEEHLTLIPLSSWLPKYKDQNKARWSQVRNLLNELLPDDTQMTGDLEDGELLFKHRSQLVSFSAMSDGYRAYIGWVGDLLYHLCMGCSNEKKLVQNKGIVLVDEVDLHLHPSWQREVIPKLAKALPNIQFILTSHSPIVVGTLHKQNIIVLNDADSGTQVSGLERDVFGLNSDQLLTSDIFGLRSTRAPEFVKAMNTVGQRMREGDDEAELLLNKMLVYGANASEDMELTFEGPSKSALAAAKRLGAKRSRKKTAPVRKKASTGIGATKKKAAVKKKLVTKKKR